MDSQENNQRGGEESRDFWHEMTLGEKRRAARQAGMKISEWEAQNNLRVALAESSVAGPDSTSAPSSCLQELVETEKEIKLKISTAEGEERDDGEDSGEDEDDIDEGCFTDTLDEGQEEEKGGELQELEFAPAGIFNLPTDAGVRVLLYLDVDCAAGVCPTVCPLWRAALLAGQPPSLAPAPPVPGGAPDGGSTRSGTSAGSGKGGTRSRCSTAGSGDSSLPPSPRSGKQQPPPVAPLVRAGHVPGMATLRVDAHSPAQPLVDQAVFRPLAARIYLGQAHKKQLNSQRWGGWRRMLILRPRLRTNGFYMLHHSYIKKLQRDMFTQVPVGQILEVNYWRYLRFFNNGTCLYSMLYQEPQEVTSLLKAGPGGKVCMGKFSVAKNMVKVEVAAPHAIIGFELEIQPPMFNGHFSQLLLTDHWSMSYNDIGGKVSHKCNGLPRFHFFKVAYDF